MFLSQRSGVGVRDQKARILDFRLRSDPICNLKSAIPYTLHLIPNTLTQARFQALDALLEDTVLLLQFFGTGSEHGVVSPPVDSHLHRFVDRGDQQAHL